MAKAKKDNNLTMLLFVVLVLAQVTSIILFVLFSRADIFLSILLFAAIQIFFTAGYLVLFIIAKKIVRLRKKICDNEDIDEQRKFDLNYYELIKSHRQEIAAMRHEIANGLQVAMSLLKSQSVEDKKKGTALLYDIGMQNSIKNDKIYCNNSIINTIIEVKAKIAKGHFIRTKFEISASENITISKLDLCSIFGNLLDNAIEAAKNADDKYIEVKAGELTGFFVIKVKNSKLNVIQKVNDEITTSKNDQEGRHGKGLKMLKKIAERYDGKLNVDYDDKSFTVVMTLKLK